MTSELQLVLRKLLEDRLAVLGLAIVLALVICALCAPWLATHPRPWVRSIRHTGCAHLAGSTYSGRDRLGADICGRLLFGARITIMIAVIAVGTAVAVGVPLGLVAGIRDGFISNLIMRTSDSLLGGAADHPGHCNCANARAKPAQRHPCAVGDVKLWPWFHATRLRRNAGGTQGDVIEATIALGASPARIIWLHILPNIVSPIIVRITLGMGFTILTAAALGFLGLGAPPPTPEWGRTIAESREYLPDAWWYAAAPGLAIFLVVLGFNMLGDGLRDVMRPKTRRAGRPRD